VNLKDLDNPIFGGDVKKSFSLLCFGIVVLSGCGRLDDSELQQATIGPVPDGEWCFVESSRRVSLPAIECGFNDIALANPGWFREDTIRCDLWIAGAKVTTRRETKYIHESCVPI
jgi:hypothetical protein